MKSKKKENKKVKYKKIENEVKRILRSNKDRLNLHEDINPFAARVLFSLIKEQEEESVEDVKQQVQPTVKNPEDFTPEANKEDFQNSLDKETESDQFDVEGVSADLTAETINTIKEWSKKLDDFAEFLNNPDQQTSEGKPSLHKILSDGDRTGSLLRGVTRKASDSITRIAGEIEKLKEILNTYIITAPKKLRDTEGQVSGWTQF